MIYKSFADSRQMKVDRDAAVAGSVAAIFPKGALPAGKGDKGQKKPKQKGKGGKGDKGKGGGDKSTCSYCGYTGHKEVDCRKKKSGEPSKAEIMDAVKQIKEKKGGSVNHVNADGWLGSESLSGDTFHVSQTYPPLVAVRRSRRRRVSHRLGCHAPPCQRSTTPIVDRVGTQDHFRSCRLWLTRIDSKGSTRHQPERLA